METNFIPEVKISKQNSMYSLTIFWKSNNSKIKIDRPSTYTILHNKNTLLRYKKAIEDRKMAINPKLEIDAYGNSYIVTSDFQMAKYLNSDLKNIGY